MSVSAPNFVVVAYPAGAAGQTISNVLSLSRNALSLFPDVDFNATAEEKFNVIYTTLQNTLKKNNGKWKDVARTNKFFGESYNKIIEARMSTHDLKNLNILSTLENKQLVCDAIASNKTFFGRVHYYYSIETLNTSFNNFKTIFIKNSLEILNARNLDLLKENTLGKVFNMQQLQEIYKNGAGSDWPKELPMCTADIEYLPVQIQEEIISYLKDIHNNTQILFYCLSDNKFIKTLGVDNIDFFYDGKNLTTENNFVDSIRELYDFFQFTDFNQNKKYICEYYKQWAKINLKHNF